VQFTDVNKYIGRVLRAIFLSGLFTAREDVFGKDYVVIVAIENLGSRVFSRILTIDNNVILDIKYESDTHEGRVNEIKTTYVDPAYISDANILIPEEAHDGSTTVQFVMMPRNVIKDIADGVRSNISLICVTSFNEDHFKLIHGIPNNIKSAVAGYLNGVTAARTKAPIKPTTQPIRDAQQLLGMKMYEQLIQTFPQQQPENQQFQ
jgi:hypothetical protein